MSYELHSWKLIFHMALITALKSPDKKSGFGTSGDKLSLFKYMKKYEKYYRIYITPYVGMSGSMGSDFWMYIETL